MSGGPERPVRPEQENRDVSEASPEEGAAPQASEEQSPERRAARGERAATPQEFYWRRQAEKLEKELAAARSEGEAELSRLTREKEEAAAKAAEAEWQARRLSLIAEAGLPTELTELVPQGDPETVAAYVEKLKPIAEKLARPRPRGLTNTNPPNGSGSDQARLERLAAEAARGDRRALREYAHLKDRVKRRS
jgi:hypothetical protein